MVAAGELPILSRFQASALLTAKMRGDTSVECSLDLERSLSALTLTEEGVHCGGKFLVSFADLQRISESDNCCFEVQNETVHPIREFSEQSNKTFQLMPTSREPALLISGFVMHRFRDVSPSEGARRMVQALAPVRGRLLDTATGLGYAAIFAAKYASEVVTIELEPAAQRMARRNPWSQPLFSDERILQKLGDSAELIRDFEPGSFQSVLHDPPAINIAGDLYSLTFYSEVFRVLSRGGKFFHYIGDPESASGKRTTGSTVRRLHDAGFSEVVRRPDAFGVVAKK